MALDHQEISKYLRSNLRITTQIEWRQQGNTERKMLVTQLLLEGIVVAETVILAGSIG